MTSRSKDIILLLGAGASAEAKIPTSATMINNIQDLLVSDRNWTANADLYNHVKSAIHYSAGLHGRFNDQVSYNIETLVNTLYELERNEEHPLYPFIAAWNSRFVALAQPDFSGVRTFRSKILQALKKWMCPQDSSQGDYYRGLVRLQQDLNFSLPVFSLNYDLCIERLARHDFYVETGFGGFGPRHVWNWERFEETNTNAPQILLYKLHGSINWKRDELTKQLFSVEQVENIDPDHMEVIFGRDFKLEAADPYLFYAYEFRRYALIAKLIVAVGYSFGDSHINKMLTQGMRDDDNRHLLVVSNCEECDRDRRTADIAAKLDLNEDEKQRVSIHAGTAKEFFQQPDLAKLLLAKIPTNPDAPF